MADKIKVKVNDGLVKFKKYGAFLPILFFLPYFIYRPTIAKCNLLMILIVYYYLCFMGPVYIIKYLIEKLDLKQKLVDILSWVCCMVMWIWNVYNWSFVFANKSDFNFSSAIFLIPFIAFIRCVEIIVIVCSFILIFNYLSKKIKKEEV
ncbi:hypothetical protein HDR60_03725 [bacterium]|nr:hypothetical protein [bacterium]